MVASMEMVVRREHSLFTPTFHVTVASLDPVHVHEAFNVQGHHDLSVAADVAMERLRQKGYRLTESMTVHDSYVMAHVVRDEREAATVELAADLVADARAIARALSGMGTRAGAEEIVRLVADLVAGAQGLKARADAVLASDSQVESAAVFEDAMSHLDGGA